MREPEPDPIAPSTVVAIVTVVDWRVSDTAAKTNTSGKVDEQPAEHPGGAAELGADQRARARRA